MYFSLDLCSYIVLDILSSWLAADISLTSVPWWWCHLHLHCDFICKQIKNAILKLLVGKKSFCKTWSEVGMEPKKVQRQGRDERTQEDYPTSAKIHTRCRVVFLRSFKQGRDERMQEHYSTSAVYFWWCRVVFFRLLCLSYSCTFSGQYQLELKFCRNFYPSSTDQYIKFT